MHRPYYKAGIQELQKKRTTVVKGIISMLNVYSSNNLQWMMTSIRCAKDFFFPE